MSYYTQFNFKVTLSKEFADKGYMDYILCCVNKYFTDSRPDLKYHQVRSGRTNGRRFFNQEKWLQIFTSNNHIEYDQEDRLKPNVIEVREKGFVRIEVHGAINHAGSELFEQFFNLISPYIVTGKRRKYVGWTYGEQQRDRTYHHVTKTFSLPCIIGGKQITYNNTFRMPDYKTYFVMSPITEYVAYSTPKDYPNITGLVKVLDAHGIIQAIKAQKPGEHYVYALKVDENITPEKKLELYMETVQHIPRAVCLCIEDIDNFTPPPPNFFQKIVSMFRLINRSK